MTATAINSREQALAGALAFAIHVLLLVLLVFGVSWQHQQMDTAVVVDLWRDLPQVPQPRAEPPPPAVKPEPPPPAPKVEVKPPPVKPAPTPTIKPDIALKEKLEKERKLKEQQAAEAKKIAEAKVREAKVREAEIEKKKRAAADALKQKQAADAAAQSLAVEQQKARDALAAQQAAAAQREIDKYMDGIRTRVRRFVLVPPSLQGNPEAEATVTLLPGGEVLDVRISKSSGNAAYDAAIESAIRKAQPFSVPAGALFQQNFRRFTMIFRPVQ